jgi:hypothetical protein
MPGNRALEVSSSLALSERARPRGWSSRPPSDAGPVCRTQAERQALAPRAAVFQEQHRRRTSAQGERGDAAPSCHSVPHVLLDHRWKAQKVALGRPDPVQRRLVGGRNTTHSMIIPVLGYSGSGELFPRSGARMLRPAQRPVTSSTRGATGIHLTSGSRNAVRACDEARASPV